MNKIKQLIKFSLLITISVSNLDAQLLTESETKGVSVFIELVKKQDITKLSNLISYPLMRQYPIEPIRNRREFLKRYHQIFDQNLVRKIIQSKTNKDWSKVGWRGIMLNQGDIWINENGQLIAVNSISNYEKKLIQKLVAIDKNRLHGSLTEYEKSVFKGHTKKVRFRIDLLKDQTYRYTSWDINKGMNEKPDLVILNGQLNIEGSIGNQIFEFKNEDYKYVVSDEEIISKNSKMMTIYKNDSVIQKDIVYF